MLPGTAAPVAEETPQVATGPSGSAFRAMRHDLGKVLRIRTLRALMVGTMIASGALNGMGFWASAFYERHTSLGTGGSAGIVAALIAARRAGRHLHAGRLIDRMRGRVVGLPMLVGRPGRADRVRAPVRRRSCPCYWERNIPTYLRWYDAALRDSADYPSG